MPKTGNNTTVGPSEHEFKTQKAKTLEGLADPGPDKSKKGGVDRPIADLLGYINNLPGYVSTSSCSGRMAVFSEADALKKQSGVWHYVSHELVDDAEEVLAAVHAGTEKQHGTVVMYKFEPFVLHLSCQSLAHGRTMLGIALQSGFKNSGMIVSKRVMVQVRGALKLEVPLAVEGKLLVDTNYIRTLVRMSNEKLQLNFDKIDRFFKDVQAHFGIDFKPAAEPVSASVAAGGDDGGTHGCSVCAAAFHSRNKLFKHIRDAHADLAKMAKDVLSDGLPI